MNNYYVYMYFEPNTCIPIYVGKGLGLRAWQHLQLCNYSQGTRRANKVRKLILEGYRLVPEILYGGLSEFEAHCIEIQLINQCGRICDGTGTLYNSTLGGDGISGYIHSEESLLKISKAAKIYWTPQRKSIKSVQMENNQNARGSKSIWRKKIACLYSKAGPIKKIYDFITQVECDGYLRSGVQHCLNGRRETAYGYFWKYLD